MINQRTSLILPSEVYVPAFPGFCNNNLNFELAAQCFCSSSNTWGMEVSDWRLVGVQRDPLIPSLLLVVLPTPTKAASSVKEGKLPRRRTGFCQRSPSSCAFIRTIKQGSSSF